MHPLILGWGDDYQLLFTIAKGKLKDAKDRIIQEQLDIVEIGEMTNEAGKITPIDEAGTPITLKTIRYEHFD